LTRYNVTVNGVCYTNQPKRRAILRVLQTLVGDGVSPSEINDLITWRTVFYQVPADADDDSIGQRLANEYGVEKPQKIWFLNEGEFVVHEGATYAVVKQWGKRTDEALRLLIKTFSPANISYEVHR
jgi:hypothetical protein